MDFAEKRHVTEEVLETYSMGRLAEPDLAKFEEHLLVCDLCQDRLAEEDRIRQGVCAGGAVLERPRAAQPHAIIWWPFPKLAWATGLVAACLALVAGAEWQYLHHPSAPPAMIVLQATRGTQDPSLAAPAGKPLTLAFDSTDLQQFPEYKLEVVDAAGHPVFQSNAASLNNKLQATLTRGLAAGNYFVRVYSPANELLREFALAVRG